ncbi:hypothetical protein TKK_0007500 [Trichogramma kaykai]|uniref:Glycoside hydrolase family 19 catalytic domain-containing protein n=1 Tax=Trichogramma kaykai TaxID=54128 RepID=A0ABD2WG20_9HYME
MRSDSRRAITIALVLVQLLRASQAYVSREEFDRAVTSNGYRKPADEVYENFAEQTKDFSREEAAMLIAQLIHESGGFVYTEEIACANTDRCRDVYRDNVGLPGKSYHGRGYIQLTWAANYRDASSAIGMGDRLLREPELVATQPRTAMLVSTWYWRDRVRPLLRPRPDWFGSTTKAINGAIECQPGPANPTAKRRYRLYEKVADALKLTKRAKENGCNA